MGQPTIYKPSVYNGNGIYKNGAGGGGGGSVNGFVIKNLWQIRATCDIDGLAFTPKGGNMWSACISFSSRTKYNLNELSKIDIQLDALCSWWNPDSQILSYGSENSSYNTGRLFGLKIITSDGKKIIQLRIADSASSFYTAYSQEIDVTLRHVYRVTLDFATKEICLYLDGDIIHRQFITNYFTSFWCPGFATENYVISDANPPGSYIEQANNTNKTLYLNNTYLKINDELIFGMEQ